jgi:hypothetical protein
MQDLHDLALSPAEIFGWSALGHGGMLPGKGAGSVNWAMLIFQQMTRKVKCPEQLAMILAASAGQSVREPRCG